MPRYRFSQSRGALLAIAGACYATVAFGQATIDNSAATANDIAARLQSSGIVISNPDIPAANTSDAPGMYGLYSNGTTGAGLQIDRGVAFSTGSITEMFTSNSAVDSTVGSATTYNDSQLTTIQPGATHNVAVMTMDLTLGSYVTGFRMRYQFGSDEYPDYVGSDFNDLFAILISGPGITGVEDIARLPSGGPTDINTVNYGMRGCQGAAGSFSALDSASYIRNGHTTTVDGGTGRLVCNPQPQPGPFPVFMEWNGLTTALSAQRSGLTPGNTYRLKIAVADVLDQSYDSGVVFEFIEATYDRDYGDAPNTGGYGNPYHDITSAMRLGAAITVETNGYNSATASADSGDDGVTIPVLPSNATTNLTVSASGAGGFLQVWFDWNQDGDFNDAGEQVGTNLVDGNSDGFIQVPVTPPSSVSTYNTFARLRWSTTSGLNATAPAASGEVEDYRVTVTGTSTTYTCPSGYSAVSRSGNASTVVVAAEFSANALGAILPAGSGLNTSNAARVRSGFTPLTLRLADIVPAGAPLTFSVARDNSAGSINIQTSADGSAFATQATFNTGTQDVAARVNVTVPAGGAEFVRFVRNAGDTWVDGVEYSAACQAMPRLEGSKNITVYDPGAAGLYAVPGNDVIYAITVTNSGAVTTDSNSVVLIDRVPAEIAVFNGATPMFGGGVVGWTQTSTGLTFTAGTDLRWSNAASAPANFAACTYTPAAGYDPAIKFICLNPKGAMAAGNPDPNFTIRIRARIH